jgi:hypothetical protein
MTWSANVFCSTHDHKVKTLNLTFAPSMEKKEAGDPGFERRIARFLEERCDQ